MKFPKFTSLIYLPVGLMAILVAISLVHSWKEIQSDGLSHQEILAPVSASGTSPGTSSVVTAPAQTVADPVILEKPAALSRFVERSQFQVKAPIPVASQTYSPPGVPNTPPVQVSMVPTGISPPSQSSAIMAAPASSAAIQSSRSLTTSYAGAASSGSYGGSFMPAAVAPPVSSSAAAQPGAAPVSGGSPVTQSSAAANSVAPSISIPAAFADPAAVGISTPDQTQQLAQIADNFTSAVQNSGVSPSSPGYQNVWNAAAQQANAIFRQQFGYAAFEAAQMNANSQ